MKRRTALPPKQVAFVKAYCFSAVYADTKSFCHDEFVGADLLKDSNGYQTCFQNYSKCKVLAVVRSIRRIDLSKVNTYAFIDRIVS